jgi:hypothetical protein
MVIEKKNKNINVEQKRFSLFIILLKYAYETFRNFINTYSIMYFNNYYTNYKEN